MIEIRWVVTGWDVSTGLLNIWVAVTFLLFLSFDLSLIPADENIILLCEKEKVRIGTCLVDRLRCYYRKDCGREYMLMKLICSGKQNVQFSVFCKCAMFSESGDVCHPLLSLPVHDLYLTHCWWVTSTSWSYRPQFYADLFNRGFTHLQCWYQFYPEE